MRQSAVVYFDHGFYFFGGWDNTSLESTLDIIARLDSQTYVWTKVGELNTPRHKHNVVTVENEFLVIGGVGYDMKSERCNYDDDQMICTEQWPELTGYYDYPELFIVNEDYCSNLQ